jgi:DnaK suppressor protein
MDKQLQDGLRRQIMQLRTNLLAQIAQQRGGVVGRAESASHFQHAEDSPAQVNTERDLEFALDERELAEVAELDAALQRLQAGTYGQCVDCSEPIALPRLQATPQAARCLACQTQKEHQS